MYVHACRYMSVHVHRLMLFWICLDWLTPYWNEYCIFITKISNMGPKGGTESQSLGKISFAVLQVFLRFCWSRFSSCCCYEEMIVYISHLVCIGKLAALPCNSSLIVSQGTMYFQLQGKGLYRVIKVKYHIPLSWINLITEVLYNFAIICSRISGFS